MGNWVGRFLDSKYIYGWDRLEIQIHLIEIRIASAEVHSARPMLVFPMLFRVHICASCSGHFYCPISSRRFSSSRLIDHRGCASSRVLQSKDLCFPVARITSLTVRSCRDGFLGSLCLVLLTWVAMRTFPFLLVSVVSWG